MHHHEGGLKAGTRFCPGVQQADEEVEVGAREEVERLEAPTAETATRSAEEEVAREADAQLQKAARQEAMGSGSLNLIMRRILEGG